MFENISDGEIDALRGIKSLADARGIPLMLVGAHARLLQLDWRYRIRSGRTTKDWDFALRVPDWASFLDLYSDATSGPDAWFNCAIHPQRLTHKSSGIVIDLVPFGGIEDETGKIEWPDDRTQMTVIGFSDAHEHAIPLKLREDLELPVVTVPALVALKFFAADERFERDNADLGDIWFVMNHYAQSDAESRLFEEPIQAMVEAGFDYQYAGAFLLGFDMATTCKRATLDALLPILSKLIKPYGKQISSLTSRSRDDRTEDEERQRIAAGFRWLQSAIVKGMGRSG